VPVILGPKKESGPSGDIVELRSKKVTALRVIFEDYDGKRLSFPSKLYVDPVKREIYITDSGHSRILVFTHDFYPLLSIGKSDGIEAPVGLTVDGGGYLYVAQSPGRRNPSARISVFNPSLRWKKDIVFAGFDGADSFQPKNVAINQEGVLYVAGGFPGAVVLNNDGTFSHLLSPMDSLGKGEKERATICDVEIDENGRIYLLSEDLGRVYVYDREETFQFKFGRKGGSSGKLSRPRGLGVDSLNKRVYVIDYMRHTANVYSDSGRFLFEFGGKGWGRGWFQYPSDINVDSLGNVLVADTFNNRVQVLSMEGLPPVPGVEQIKPETSHSEEPVEQVKPRIVATKKSAKGTPRKYYVLTSNMNLREKRSTASRVIRLMREGEEFEIIFEPKHRKATTWYLIKTRSGDKGWFCGVYRGRVRFVKKENK
jgi:DNA-binding beta-propeller fold protein YncE